MKQLSLGLIRAYFSNARSLTEFKEIRKEWKARKKEEEAQRKAAEEAERQRQAQAQAAAQAAAQAQNGGPDPQAAEGQGTPSYPTGRQVQLPPIGYQPTQYSAPPLPTTSSSRRRRTRPKARCTANVSSAM